MSASAEATATLRVGKVPVEGGDECWVEVRDPLTFLQRVGWAYTPFARSGCEVFDAQLDDVTDRQDADDALYLCLCPSSEEREGIHAHTTFLLPLEDL